jgi:Cu+-exporting ATPase
VLKETGEIVYAGGKQTGGNIEILVIKEVAQSYLTKLWNRDDPVATGFKKKDEIKSISFVHLLSRYFTYIVFAIATVTAIYWKINDVHRLWPAVTSIFIIACPCALLLSNTFTNGNILSILGRNHFYLRSAQTIEDIANADHIVFDKTGTLTSGNEQDIIYEGEPLTIEQQQQVAALASHSSHPLSKALVKHIGITTGDIPISGFEEATGQGISGFAGGHDIRIGSKEFITGEKNLNEATAIYISIGRRLRGCFRFSNHYRESAPLLIRELKKDFQLSLISGDTGSERGNLKKILGAKTELLFNQKPEDKLDYIKLLQQKGKKVMMIGDGLNDAGALKQSNIGIAVSEQTNNFTPASDAIIEAGQLSRLSKFIQLCRANKNIVVASFVLSIVYNIIGLYFAVQGTLAPLIAAILMPASSLSILLITFGSSNLLAKSMKL